ncbi:MAG TPA: hypothetical protein VLM87_08775, partial [Rubrivivax sp.]|nr:hypothetical protein [Rubrivivax sp.]
MDKPKRTRAPRKVAAGAEAPAEVSPDVDAEPAPAAGAGLERPPAVVQAGRTEPAASGVPQGAAAAPAEEGRGYAPEAGSTGVSEAGAAAEAGAEAGVGIGGEPGAGGRRGRNRRRGRRDAERGEGAEAAPGASAEGVGAGAGEQLDAPAIPRLPAPEAADVFAQVLSGAYDEEPAPIEA